MLHLLTCLLVMQDWIKLSGAKHDLLDVLQSLPRHPLKLDRETSGLANRVRELLLNASEVSKDQVSSLS